MPFLYLVIFHQPANEISCSVRIVKISPANIPPIYRIYTQDILFYQNRNE